MWRFLQCVAASSTARAYIQIGNLWEHSHQNIPVKRRWPIRGQAYLRFPLCNSVVICCVPQRLTSVRQVFGVHTGVPQGYGDATCRGVVVRPIRNSSASLDRRIRGIRDK